MRGVYNFIIKPKGSRYNNTKKIGDKELIVNTDNFQHQYVSRNAIVISVPRGIETEIQQGDEVIVHHNVFRRYNDIKGVERDSKSYYKDDMYFTHLDQIFAYNKNDTWKPLEQYCFVKPIKSYSKFDINKEEPLIGVIKHTNKHLPEVGSLVGFTPSSEYEFVIDGERLYRIRTQDITIKYEYQGKEEEYNPSWV